jgi:hypothetical protein
LKATAISECGKNLAAKQNDSKFVETVLDAVFQFHGVFKLLSALS